MSQAKVIALKPGKNQASDGTRHLYAKIRNGNVYRHKSRMAFSQYQEIQEAIAKDPVIRLKHWEIAIKKGS